MGDSFGDSTTPRQVTLPTEAAHVATGGNTSCALLVDDDLWCWGSNSHGQLGAASLDAQSGLLVTEMLRELARERGHTVVVVTHDNRIFHLADRVLRIEDGVLWEDPR